jgi:hypothetical protein
MANQPSTSILVDRPLDIYCDLADARLYLHELAVTLQKAANSANPREVWLALALLRMQAQRMP